MVVTALTGLADLGEICFPQKKMVLFVTFLTGVVAVVMTCIDFFLFTSNSKIESDLLIMSIRTRSPAWCVTISAECYHGHFARSFCTVVFGWRAVSPLLVQVCPHLLNINLSE